MVGTWVEESWLFVSRMIHVVEKVLLYCRSLFTPGDDVYKDHTSAWISCFSQGHGALNGCYTIA